MARMTSDIRESAKSATGHPASDTVSSLTQAHRARDDAILVGTLLAR